MVRAVAMVAGFAVLALAGCGSGNSDQSASGTAAAPGSTASVAVADTARPPAVFGACAACHSVKPGMNGIGPSLAGVFGRKAGIGPAYNYSAALKGSGLTWDEATLDKWLTNPMGMVPGTRMTYAGQGDAAKRAELIAYLKTLK